MNRRRSSISRYMVLAFDDKGCEIRRSAVASVRNNLFVEGACNRISWRSNHLASYYVVLKAVRYGWGSIGRTERTVFDDDNIKPSGLWPAGIESDGINWMPTACAHPVPKVST